MPDGLASNKKQNRGKKNFKVPGLGGVDCNHHHNKVIDMSPKAASLTVCFTEKENKVQRQKGLVQDAESGRPPGPV